MRSSLLAGQPLNLEESLADMCLVSAGTVSHYAEDPTLAEPLGLVLDGEGA